MQSECVIIEKTGGNMDKKTSKYVFAAIYGVSFVALAVGMFTLFVNFTIGKSSLDLAYDANAAPYVYALSIVGFVFCAVLIVFCIMSCVGRTRGFTIPAVVFGIITTVALIVIMIVANISIYDEEHKFQSSSYLLVSTFQASVLQVLIPIVIIVILSCVVMIKSKSVNYDEDCEETEEDTDEEQ